MSQTIKILIVLGLALNTGGRLPLTATEETS